MGCIKAITYNPRSNLLLTSWHIQVGRYFLPYFLPGVGRWIAQMEV